MSSKAEGLTRRAAAVEVAVTRRRRSRRSRPQLAMMCAPTAARQCAAVAARFLIGSSCRMASSYASSAPAYIARWVFISRGESITLVLGRMRWRHV